MLIEIRLWKKRLQYLWLEVEKNCCVTTTYTSPSLQRTHPHHYNVHIPIITTYTSPSLQCTHPHHYNVHIPIITTYTSPSSQRTHPHHHNVHIPIITTYTSPSLQHTHPHHYNVHIPIITTYTSPLRALVQRSSTCLRAFHLQINVLQETGVAQHDGSEVQMLINL